MKSYTLLVLVGALMAFQNVQAQDFSASNSRRPTLNARQERPTDFSVKTVPKGALHKIDKHGLIMLSPTAPLKYGFGQDVLTENITKHNPPTGDEQDKKKEFGGIALIGFEF
jgi:hypothetical protein